MTSWPKSCQTLALTIPRSCGKFAGDGQKEHTWSTSKEVYIEHVKYQPFHSLDAALYRLRRRYDLDIENPWFTPVEQIVRTIYALADVLGVGGMLVLNLSVFIQRLTNLVIMHPAFAGEKAGPYMFLAHNPPWAISNVLRDLGFRPGPDMDLGINHVLAHVYWIPGPLREVNPQLIERLCELRAEAVVARCRQGSLRCASHASSCSWLGSLRERTSRSMLSIKYLT
jgi:hypothetical protein